jgi:hypothetical protein
MTLRVLDGRLSATFNLVGPHYQRYLDHPTAFVGILCDQLLLHDEILIPTHDYVTAAVLVRILGAPNVIELLEEERIRFVRLRGFFGYVRGSGIDGRLVAMDTPNPASILASAPFYEAIEKMLATTGLNNAELRRLSDLVIAQTTQIELSIVMDAIHRDAYADLSQTVLWRDSYRFPNPDLVALPGIGKMSVRSLGPETDVSNNVIDACLALGLMNAELYLAKQFSCDSISTGSPIGDCVALKLPRLMGKAPDHQKLWNFLEVTGVPDISGALLEDPRQMKQYLALTRSGDAVAFRHWFHEKADLNERELLKAYIDVLQKTPWVRSKGGKALRMVATLGLGAFGLGHAVDAAASVVDNFVVDEYVRGRGAKFFVERLKRFSGRLKLRALKSLSG